MFQYRRINKITWWIWSPTVASVIFLVFLFLLVSSVSFYLIQDDPIKPNHLLVIITAIYTLITYFTLYSSITNSKAQLLVSLYDLLKIQSDGKKFLLDPEYTWSKIRGDKVKEQELLKLIILLDRAATMAFQIGAVKELLVRYWDWYYNVFKKYPDFLQIKSKTKVTDLLHSVGSQASFDSLTEDQKHRAWLFHLFEMENEVKKYIDKNYPFLKNNITEAGKIDIKVRF